jgi:diadenosine tetraphosphate (Ap4A) HIT family hydrolase
MRFDTARNKEQTRRMRECQKNNICYLCNRIATKSLITHEGKYWFIIENDFPYEGSVHHYLIISKRHTTRTTDLSKDEWLEKIKMLKWLEKYLGVNGFSEFSRNGDMMYTHASLDHLHFHFLVGDKKQNNSEKIKVTLGYKKMPR